MQSIVKNFLSVTTILAMGVTLSSADNELEKVMKVGKSDEKKSKY